MSKAPETIPDVWQWTQPKYRIRSLVLLLVDALLFAGLGCFTFWLRTGVYTPLGMDRYWSLWWEACDPIRERQITLIDFLIYPIPADQVPMMMVIMGLVLASLTAIPILVSMLYRFWFSLIFTAIIAFVAVVPWLAVTVTLCCCLARWRRLQFSFRYATALVSLLPLVAYYLLATRNASAVENLGPFELAKLYMPWGLALIAACVVMALVLTIAWLVNYRPGALAPLLAVMFAVPVILFEARVGRDELYYRLLETRVGPGSKVYFVRQANASGIIRWAAEDRVRATGGSAAEVEGVAEQILVALQLQVGAGRARPAEVAQAISEIHAGEQRAAIEECRRFRSRFPASRYIPNALYLEGRAIDLRVDRDFSLSQTALLPRFYEDFPNAASEGVWKELHEHSPDSPLASVALMRHATLEIRDGNVPQALTLLGQLIGRFGTGAGRKEEPASSQPAGWRSFLAKRPASGSLGVDPSAVAQDGRELVDLLEKNRTIEMEPQYKYPALARLFRCNPHHPLYRSNLKGILALMARDPRFGPSRLRDTIEVLVATTDPSLSRRIDQLSTLVKKLAKDPANNALPRARFELGLAYQTDDRIEEARAVFEAVQHDYPGSPWAFEASSRLATTGQPGG